MAPDLKSLLFFAREKKATELYLSVDGPVEILVGSRRSTLGVPPIEAAEFDALLRQHLDERERAILESQGSIGSLFELQDVGLVRARIIGRAATFILPVPEAPFQNTTVTSLVQLGIDRLAQLLNTPLFKIEMPRLRQLRNRFVSEPFFSSRVFPLPFILIGLVALYGGGSNLVLAYASKSWASSMGTIRYSAVETRKHLGSRTMYFADVTYSFAVDSLAFEGKRVNFGSAGINAVSVPSYAEDVVKAYPPGLDVRVYYDPENPKESVLEPGITFYSLLWPFFGLAFLVAGLMMAIFLPKLMRRRYPRII